MLLFEIGLFKHFTFDLHKKDTLIFRYNLETCQTNFPQQRDLLFSYLLLRTSGQNFALRHYKDISRLPNIMYMLCRRGRETTLQIGRGQTIVCIHQSVKKNQKIYCICWDKNYKQNSIYWRILIQYVAGCGTSKEETFFFLLTNYFFCLELFSAVE